MALGFIEAEEDVWECPPDPDEIISVLAAEFSTEDLIESRIAVAEEDGRIVLAPALTGGASFVVLRDADSGHAYELLTDAGCPSADALPVFEILRDARTQQLLEQGSGELVVACDVENVALLRACGLPATLATGLDELPLEQAERFSESFESAAFRRGRLMSQEGIREDLENPLEGHPEDPLSRMMRNMVNGEEASAEQPATCDDSGSVNSSTEPVESQLVFLGWTPSELSSAAPPPLSAVVDHLRQLERFLDVCLDDIGLWEADEETIERLRFIAERRSAAIFKQALLDAAENIDACIGQFGEAQLPAIGPPNDYTTALIRFQESSSAEDRSGWLDQNQTSKAWRDVQRLLCQQVVGPLRELALATLDPVQRNLLMGFAELSHVFHLQSVVMGEQLSRRIAERGGEVPEDQFKKWMALTDRLIGMAKATERCSQPTATIIESNTSNSPSFPRLPHSD